MRKYKAKRKSKLAGVPRTFNGKRVEDAPEEFEFHVTESQRRRGKKDDECECAGALGIKKDYPGDVVEVYLHRNVTFIELKTKVIRYKTSVGLRDQVLRFDAGKKFDAGTYKLLRLPPSQIKARGQQHSPPDRAHGVVNGPNARKSIKAGHDLGRSRFHFTAKNSDFKSAVSIPS